MLHCIIEYFVDNQAQEQRLADLVKRCRKIRSKGIKSEQDLLQYASVLCDQGELLDIRIKMLEELVSKWEQEHEEEETFWKKILKKGGV